MTTALFIAPKTDRTSLFSAEDRGGVAVDRERERARLIVADGAGTAHMSGLLAELIVSSFLADPDGEPPIAPADNTSYQQWHQQVSEEWNKLAQELTGEAWYLQRSLARGSAAAFAAAVVDPDGCWCVALGDCCLFQIRPDHQAACVATFPMRSWPAFNSSPALFNTDLDVPAQWPHWTRLELRPGDVIAGASDGIAEWVLAAAVQNPEVWRLLVELSAPDFTTMVAEERRLGTMVDDDSILVRLVIGEDP